MDRISGANATVDHKFQDGDSGTGQRATSFNAAWANDVQEELVTIIEAAGITPESGAQQLYKAMVNLQYRVGDYLHTESEVTPATRWPWQTWTEVTGRVLVGYDSGQTEFNAIGKQDGEKTHTLTANEMPGHRHLLAADTSGDGDSVISTNQLFREKTSGGDSGYRLIGTATDATLGRSSSVGGGAAHNNLQPYRVVHVWRRTA